ncbi:MAG: hypothetical protein ACLGIY_15180, partial [Betaproteobacteria bacterium]
MNAPCRSVGGAPENPGHVHAQDGTALQAHQSEWCAAEAGGACRMGRPDKEGAGGRCAPSRRVHVLLA